MKPCNCGLDGVGPISGIFFGLNGSPHHVSFNCPGCGTTRGIRWEEAPEEIRREGIEQEKLRMRKYGLI